MSIRGYVTVEHRDKNGLLKHHISKHNTITELGKSSALFFGTSALAATSFSTPKTKTGYPQPSKYMMGDYVSMIGAVPQKTDTVECLLLSDTAASIAAKDNPELFNPSPTNIIGFANSKVAGDTLSTGEGIRTDANVDILGSKVVLKYSWENGLTGDVNTIGMRLPLITILHNITNFFNTSYHYIPQKQNGVPVHAIAAGGASYNRLLDLDTLSLSDFTPAGSFDNVVAICTLEYNGYTVEMITNKLRVTNNSNSVTYEETWTGIRGLFVRNNNLYAYVVSGGSGTLYKLTLTDSQTASTAISDISSVLNSEWQTVVSNLQSYLCGLADGSFLFAQYKSDSGSNWLYFVPDTAASTKYFVYSGLSAVTAFTTYCGNVIFESLNKIIPAGQFGTFYSYFDLEQTWTIEATDTVKVTYIYDLTEVA
jgi:hypothetical protein